MTDGTSSTTTARTPPGGRYGSGSHIVCDNLVRVFTGDGVEVVALQGLDLLVDRGELVAVVGASGSGKSTLLSILSGLDAPTAGTARVAGHDLTTMGRRERVAFRRHTMGFIWQQHSRNLLPHLTAAENVTLPMTLTGTRRRRRRTRALDLLDLLGVGACRDQRPAQMSGGQQQRVAIAVAVANSPDVLLADEPTGELDTRTAGDVLHALSQANTELGTTVLVVTHDPLVAEHVHRTVAIRDGRTAAEIRRHTRVDEHGQHHVVAQEYAVLDRAGRLQIPRDFVGALDLRDRVRLELEPGHVSVWPGHVTPAGTPDPGPGSRRA